MLTAQAHPEDWPAIESLLTRSHLPCADLSVASLASFLVIREDGEVIGVVGLEHHAGSALLRSLAVQEGFQQRGVASQLTHDAERAARGKGARAIYLLTTTAEGFFAKHGYERITRDSIPDDIKATPEYMGLCPATAVCMRKTISAA